MSDGVEPPVPRLGLFARARIAVEPALELGPVPLGQRRVVSIRGGRIDGERVQGEILPGGADWQLVSPDGIALPEARYVIRTDDGALISVRNTGVRHGPAEVLERIGRGEQVDPASYYFRATPVFETSDAGYAWLNGVVAVASGARTSSEVLLAFYAVT